MVSSDLSLPIESVALAHSGGYVGAVRDRGHFEFMRCAGFVVEDDSTFPAVANRSSFEDRAIGDDVSHVVIDAATEQLLARSASRGVEQLGRGSSRDGYGLRLFDDFIAGDPRSARIALGPF